MAVSRFDYHWFPRAWAWPPETDRYRAAISFSVSRATNCNNWPDSSSHFSPPHLSSSRVPLSFLFSFSFSHFISVLTPFVINSRYILFSLSPFFRLFFFLFISFFYRFYPSCSFIAPIAIRIHFVISIQLGLNLLFFLTRSHVYFILPFALNAMRL